MESLQKTFRNTVLLLTSLFVLAFAQNAQAQCAFNNLDWEVEDCVNGTFYVTFSFINPNPSEDGFAVHKDFPAGHFVSMESYGESSYTVGPFAGDGSTFYQFTLYDYSTNNCEGNISVGVVDCPPSDECSLFASAQQSDCFEAGQFQWMFYVNPINNGTDAGYTIYNAANEQVYFSETYANNQNYALVEAISNGVGETVTFSVADNNNPDCQQTVTAVDLGCSLCEIEITELTVVDCIADEEYYVQLSVESNNSVSGQFYVSASYNFATQYGPYNYGEESYTVGPFNLLGDENWVVATDAEEGQGSCTFSYTIGEIVCPLECDLEIGSYDVIINPEEACGEFGASFQFTPSTNNTENVSIYADGEFLFSHPADIVTVWPIQGDGINPVTMTFVSDVIADCETSVVIPAEEYCLPPECLLASMVVGVTDCDDLGEYYVLVDVHVENPTSATFTATALGQTFGPYEYGGNVYEIGPFSGEIAEVYSIFIQDTENENCNSTIDVESPICAETCVLDITSVTPTECLNGQFYVELAITAENGFSDAFNLLIGAHAFEALPYGQGTYTVGPITENTSGLMQYQASVYDPANDSCSDFFVFTVDCEDGENCTLDITSATPTECVDGQFFVDLDITAETGFSDAFNLVIGNDMFEGLPYGQGTYTVGPVNQNNNGLYQVGAYDPTNDNCNGAFEFVVECAGVPDCILDITSVTTTECTTGEFFAELEITSESNTSDIFNILIGVQVFSGQIYGQGTYTVGPIPESSLGSYIASVNDPFSDDCYDSFTFDVECTPICSLVPSNFAPINCESNEVYFIGSIETEDTGSEGFTVMLNGENYGNYEYEVINYEFGPFPYFPGEDYIFEFIDNEIGASCAGTYNAGSVNLEFCSDYCFVNLDALEVTECNANGEFFLDFEVSTTLNSPSTSFIAILGSTGQQFGPFDYGQDVYTAGPFIADGTVNDFLYVEDATGVTCGAHELLFSDPECEVVCGIDISFVEVGSCNSSGEVAVTFGITSSNPVGTSFLATIEGNAIGLFDYGQDSYTFNAVDGTQLDDFELTVVDDDAGDCISMTTFASPACIANECSIEVISIEPMDCTESEFYASITVNTTSPGGQTFSVIGAGVSYGNFFYGQDVYEIGPIDYEEGQPYVFLLVDDELNSDCSTAYTLPPFDFLPCFNPDECFTDIGGLEVGECNENGEFYLSLIVIGAVGDEGNFIATLSSTGEEFGPFDYNLGEPYIIGPITSNAGIEDLVTVSRVGDLPCEGTEEAFVHPICEPSDCGFADLSLDYQGCNEEDGTMYLVNFNAIGTEGLGFDVIVNGEFLSFHLYEDLPVVIGIPAQPDNFAVINFCDNDNPNCCTETFADVVNCDETGECGLGLNGAQFTDCIDGSFNIFVPTINTFGVLSETFNAYINDVFVGNFSYDQEDWLFGPATVDGETQLVLTIIDSENETCPASLLFGTPNPCGNTPECQINIPFVEVGECNADGQFFVDFEMLPVEDGGTVQITGNGQNYGIYDYNLPLYTVGPFDGTETATYELIVTDTENPDCVQILSFASANCNAEECNMSLTFDEYANCFGDNQFYVIVSVTNGNVDEGSFTFVGNGQDYGTEEYGAGSYAVGPFDGGAGIIYELLAIDNQDVTCSVELVFEGQECDIEPTCELEIAFIENHECDEGAQFLVDFGIVGLADGDQFSVFGNGEQYGTFTFGEDFYTVGPFNGDGADYDLIIEVLGQDGCIIDGFVQGQNCLDNFPCGFSDISTEYNGCSDDGVYFYTLDFIPVNTTNEFFDLVINGELSFHAYADLPLDIQILPSGEDVAVLAICDNDNPDCCQEIFIELPECETGMCNISVIEYELTECDEIGNFYVDFSVGVANPMSDLFFAFHNGTTYGPFEFGQSTYQIGPLDGLETAVFEIDIYVEDNEECSTQIVFDSANCEPNEDCSLSIPEFDLIDCDPDNQFYVQFAVDANSPDAATFVVTGNGENYGTFNYEDGFYTVGPFDGNLDPVWELIVTDTENEECSTFITFVSPDCDENDCSLEIYEFEFTECDEEGQFYVIFEVEVMNPNSGTFEATVFGENYGTFNYGDDNYLVGPFDGNLDPVWELIITDTENGECSNFYSFVSPGCNANDCNLDNIGAIELSPCNDEGQFYVDILMLIGSGGTGSFTVSGNGENYGTFDYGEDFYTVGPFNGDGVSTYELIAIDNEFEECSYVATFDASDCGLTPPCNLSALEYELDCVDDDFYINLFFTATGDISDTYSVSGNGTSYGVFTYENGGFGETVLLGPLPGGDAIDYEFIVIDTGNDGCNTVLELGQVNTADCTTGNGEVCNLEVAEYLPTECNDEGEFFIQIFLTEGSFGSTFQIFKDAEVFGPFEYGEDVYTVGPFPSWEGGFNLEIYDTGFDQCFDNIDIEDVDCPISDCFIENLEVEIGACNDENTHSVTINFFYNDIGGEFFNLIYEEEVIGTYETANLPITIEDFGGNGDVETLTVCMTDFDDCCVSIDFLTPQCEGLVTWPGDGNYDGITNNMDILNMGVAYGFEGPARSTDNVSWDAQDAFAWGENFITGVNYVHADADGNGEVNMLDAEIVSTNYDLTHDEVTPYVDLAPNDSSPELFVDMPDPFELQQGMEFNAPIIFGLEGLPVDNVYGLAFTLRYDPEIIDPSSILLEYPVSWLGFPQTNLMTFDYHDIDLGEIDVAITKIDQNNVSGWGEILSFIGIIDNIAGKTEIFIEIDQVTAILSNEERFPVNTPTEITTITSTENINELQGFDLFPNPTNDIVRIKNETGLSLQSIQISDLNGKVLRNVKGENSFDLSELPSGVYMAKVIFEGKTVYRRVIRM